MAKLALSAADQESLRQLEPKLQLIRDRARGVVEGFHTGFYLWGEGGTSKSYTVLEQLQNSQADYVVHNSRMTGRGLVDALKRQPSSCHLIEDCESIFDDKRAWGVLRSALWGQSTKRPVEREITWAASRTDIRFVFTGGIILIANRPLEDRPELAALGTRLPVLRLVATPAEVAALMRSVALRGFRLGRDAATPKQCLEVAEYVIGRMRALDRPLDLRVYVNGVKDYLQDKAGHSDTGWKDLVETGLRRTTVLRESRSDVKAREASVALELSRLAVSAGERMRLWKERTRGKSERAYYRRLKGLAVGSGR